MSVRERPLSLSSWAGSVGWTYPVGEIPVSWILYSMKSFPSSGVPEVVNVSPDCFSPLTVMVAVPEYPFFRE